jgi:hypothetical protein
MNIMHCSGNQVYEPLIILLYWDFFKGLQSKKVSSSFI